MLNFDVDTDVPVLLHRCRHCFKLNVISLSSQHGSIRDEVNESLVINSHNRPNIVSVDLREDDDNHESPHSVNRENNDKDSNNDNNVNDNVSPNNADDNASHNNTNDNVSNGNRDNQHNNVPQYIMAIIDRTETDLWQLSAPATNLASNPEELDLIPCSPYKENICSYHGQLPNRIGQDCYPCPALYHLWRNKKEVPMLFLKLKGRKQTVDQAIMLLHFAVHNPEDLLRLYHDNPVKAEVLAYCYFGDYRDPLIEGITNTLTCMNNWERDMKKVEAKNRINNNDNNNRDNDYNDESESDSDDEYSDESNMPRKILRPRRWTSNNTRSAHKLKYHRPQRSGSRKKRRFSE